MFPITFANPVVTAAGEARRRLPTAAALAILVATLLVAMVGGQWLTARLVGAGEPHPLLDRVVLFVCIMGPLIAAAAGLLAWEARPSSAGWTAWAATPFGALLGGGGFLLAFGAAAWLGGVRSGGAAALMPLGLLGWLAGLGLTLFQSWGEEFLFRGWLQPLLGSRWGPWVGLAATSVAFGAAHAILRPPHPVALVNDCLAGAVFGLLALRTGGLWAPTAAHFAWNAVEMSGVGATPNPGLDPLGALVDLDLTGPGWLGGGADEMNGAVTATLVLLALLAGLILAAPRRD